MQLRPYRLDDRDAVLRLNNQAVPAVSPLDGAALDQLVEWATSVTVVEVGDRWSDVVGFLIALSGPGLEYGSDNYRWLCDRYSAFLYVDRVVVAPEAKGQGLGQELYRQLVEAGRGHHPVMVAEVNTRPRNDASLHFHERFGFTAVGTAETEGGEKEVVYLELELGVGAE